MYACRAPLSVKMQQHYVHTALARLFWSIFALLPRKAGPQCRKKYEEAFGTTRLGIYLYGPYLDFGYFRQHGSTWVALPLSLAPEMCEPSSK